LARVLRTRERGGAPCREVRSLAAGKLAEVEARLTELVELRGELRSILAEWDSRLTGATEGARAGLLESLAGRAGRRGGKGPGGAPRVRASKRAERRKEDDEED
ncbi:MAG: MerR family DNA-binding protein, partial [Acidobacteria bacterium]|nr:MerR family DNA-binding protein [Acidobacteriota bacterium]